MPEGLDIYRNRLLIGHISFPNKYASNDFTFSYDQEYLDNKDAYGLGMNIPLTKDPIDASKLLN
jgi:HipA-like protein